MFVAFFRDLSGQVDHLRKEAAAQEGQVKELQRALRDLDAARDALQEEVREKERREGEREKLFLWILIAITIIIIMIRTCPVRYGTVGRLG